jgi:hypothetical protein
MTTYFIYFDYENFAMFRVREGSGEDIVEVLGEEGVRSNNTIARRRREIVEPILPPRIVPREQAPGFPVGFRRSVGITASLASNLGFSIARLANCNIM